MAPKLVVPSGFAWVAITLSQACTSEAAQDSTSVRDAANDVRRPCTDAELESYRLELLDLAIESASKFPTVPHEKNRSRLQHSIAEAALELGLPRRALQYGERISNWRRGVVHAGYALYCAKHGVGTLEEIREHLDTANQVGEQLALEVNPQKWRRDRIRARAGAALVHLGEFDQADEAAVGIEDAEASQFALAKADTLEEASFVAQLEAFDQIIEVGGFDQVQPVFVACLRLLDRFYSDSEKRSALFERLDRSKAQVPVSFYLLKLNDLIEIAIRNGDLSTAKDRVRSACGLVDTKVWQVEHEVPLRAQLARLRFAVGERDEALEDADAAVALYDGGRATIVDIYRAESLRPLAEAYYEMGARGKAMMLFKRVVDEGARNPNARPRADDLCATCISLARHSIQPDSELSERLRQVAGGLTDPW